MNQVRVVESGFLSTYTIILRADFAGRFQDEAYEQDGQGSPRSFDGTAAKSSVSSATSALTVGAISRNSLKSIRAKAVKAVFSALEGRSDTRVLEEIYV